MQCRRHQFDSCIRKIRWRRDRLPTSVFLDFPGGSAGKESACNVETLVWSLGWEDPLEKGKATPSSTLVWRIPWTIQSIGWQRVRLNSPTFTFTSQALPPAAADLGQHNASSFSSIWSVHWTLCCCWCLVAKSRPTLLWPQAPMPVGFRTQEYWSGLPFSSPGELES